MEDRIQKIIAAAGIASRRAAEEIILEGRVRVNGAVVTELGAKADPEKDHIKVDGKLINPKQPKTYIMLNKPAGCVTTVVDPEGRPTVMELLKGVKVRVYPVGRLDYDTEGLLLLTNDGDFAFRVTHPSHELPKTYQVKIKGVLADGQIDELERGVYLKDGKTAPARVRKLRKEEANSWIEVTIHEGRKRQVRRMIDHTGHSVIKLRRVKVGSLGLGDLPLGSFRHLTPEEVSSIQEIAQGGEAVAKPSARPAAAGFIPEFIGGPKPRVRTAAKKLPEHAGRPYETKAGGQGQRRQGEERSFAGRSRKAGEYRERQERQGARGGKGRPGRPFRSDRPLFRSERPHEDNRLRPGAGQGRPIGRGRPPDDEGRERSAVQRRPFGDRPMQRQERGGGWQGERGSGKAFFGRKDHPFGRTDAKKEQGGTGRFGSSRSDRAYGGPRREGAGQPGPKPSAWRSKDRSQRTGPFSREQGQRTGKPGRSAFDRPRGRTGAAQGPKGRPVGRPKGPAKRRP